MLIIALMKIASSNIRFENPADGPNDWPLRRDLWRNMISQFSPWILGTQEGRRPQLEDVATLLGEFNLVSDHREWIEERMYPCLFYDESKVDLLRSGDSWLSQTPEVPGSKSFDSAFPRLCTWAEFKLKSYGLELFVVNTHLDHMQAHTRAHQISVLLHCIKKENSRDLPLILMGDFNEDPFGEVRQSINQHMPSLIDPWFQLNLPEESSHHKFSGHNPEGSRIDWILVDGIFKPKSIELDKSSNGNTWPSDHFMVKLELKL